jgi:pyrimidine operon attenuation protein/uracil phosphoribosyltransferase
VGNQKTKILDHKQICRKIDRMAYQIYEENSKQKKILLAGIADNGYFFARLLEEKLQAISPLETELLELRINKKNPLKSESLLDNKIDFKDKSVVMVDDVLNSGRTMMYGIKPFLQAPLRRLAIAVLVDRSHKRYPLHADYVGVSLATTLKEHIEVDFSEKENYSAYLQ